MFNFDCLNNKMQAINKMNQITKAEALNQMEVIKQDKLLPLCECFTIENEDDVEDCDTLICAQYWQEIYYIGENGEVPIPLPLYHPDCECFVVPLGKQLAPIDNHDIISEALYQLQLEIETIQEKYLESITSILIDYYNFIRETKPKLLTNKDKWTKDNNDINVYNKWHDDVKEDILDLLNDMMEEVYSTTSSELRIVYGEHDYPISKIAFYDKDGKTIEERLDRWFNFYKE